MHTVVQLPHLFRLHLRLPSHHSSVTQSLPPSRSLLSNNHITHLAMHCSNLYFHVSGPLYLPIDFVSQNFCVPIHASLTSYVQSPPYISSTSLDIRPSTPHPALNICWHNIFPSYLHIFAVTPNPLLFNLHLFFTLHSHVTRFTGRFFDCLNEHPFPHRYRSLLLQLSN